MKRYLQENDDVLVELALLGEDAAFEALVLRHEGAVKASAYAVTGNRFSAEDASQDAFVSAWMRLDTLRERMKFGSWVSAIARNCALNLVRHYENKIGDISLDLLENAEALSSDESGLLSLLSAAALGEAERDAELHAAVDALSQKLRETVCLHYFDGLSVSEIAEKLSLPEGTVKWRLSEGRKQLRKEYGMTEKTYNENEALVSRVMRQVEELKLWKLKNNKTGFEADYRRVLQSVEALTESTEKQHALADVLLRGYWWLPGERSREVFLRIKEAAEKSRNEDVMQTVMASEHDEYKGSARLDYMRDTQIPYLEALGMPKTKAYVWFWYGRYAMTEERWGEAEEAMHRVLSILTPADVYYANARSALRVCNKHAQLAEAFTSASYDVTGEIYRCLDGKLYLWQQPGFSYDSRDLHEHGLFWNASQCDGLICDVAMKVGESVRCSDGRSTLVFERDGLTVVTPAGRFEHCSAWVFRGESHALTYAETVICPGVGIVRQRLERDMETHEWLLCSYTVKGGSGLIPFAEGNVWRYLPVEEPGILYEREPSTYEVTAFSHGAATVSAFAFARRIGYADTWEGNILRAKREYWRTVGEDRQELVPVADAFRRAAALAVTKRQKRHTAIAADVMERIFRGDPSANPDYTEKGNWDFFSYYAVRREGERVLITEQGNKYSFEWKDMEYCGDEGRKVLYSFLYDLLSEATGMIWSDKWVPGYAYDEKSTHYGYQTDLHFEVAENESVETPAGRFENCRHIVYRLKGMKGGLGYFGGHKEFWFAPGVGIVRFRTLYKKETLECVWELTEYEGTGEGYFPSGDGFRRRYAPRDLGNGWHGMVEYLFDEDDTGTILFRNARGTQDRKNYESDAARAKEAEKKATE